MNSKDAIGFSIAVLCIIFLVIALGFTIKKANVGYEIGSFIGSIKQGFNEVD